MNQIKIQYNGHYLESSDPQVDPDGYNDSQKKKDFQENKQTDIDRSACSFQAAWKKIYQSQRFQTQISKAEGQYKVLINSLIVQSNTVKDLITDSIIGVANPNEQLQLQPSEYLAELSSIQSRLAKLDLEVQKGFKRAKPQNLKEVFSQDAKPHNDLQLELCIGSENEFHALEQRVNQLKKVLGSSQLTKSPDGYYYKGFEFIKTQKFQPKKERQELQTQVQVIADIEPRSLFDHVQQIKYQARILANDEEVIGNLKQIQQQLEQQQHSSEAANDFAIQDPYLILRKSESHPVTKKDEVGNSGKKEETSSLLRKDEANYLIRKNEENLMVLSEIPSIIQRMGTLKVLHQSTLSLPQQIDELSQQFTWMLDLLKDSENVLLQLEN